MDVKYINPFIGAAVDVVNTLGSIKAEAGKPYLKKESTAKGDISGVIGLTGDVKGSISVSFTEKCILGIVSNMFGEEMKELNAEIDDAVGEIFNMISGQARQQLEEMGRSLDDAIPTVIRSADHCIRHITEYPVIAIPFKTNDGDFTIEIAFENEAPDPGK